MTPETATVYRARDGKRFFTKRAAILRDVVCRMRERHEPDGCDDELFGGDHRQTVYYTEGQWQHFRDVANRYYRMFCGANRIGSASMTIPSNEIEAGI